jgi:hypothetical protein
MILGSTCSLDSLDLQENITIRINMVLKIFEIIEYMVSKTFILYY